MRHQKLQLGSMMRGVHRLKALVHEKVINCYIRLIQIDRHHWLKWYHWNYVIWLDAVECNIVGILFCSISSLECTFNFIHLCDSNEYNIACTLSAYFYVQPERDYCIIHQRDPRWGCEGGRRKDETLCIFISLSSVLECTALHTAPCVMLCYQYYQFLSHRIPLTI